MLKANFIQKAFVLSLASRQRCGVWRYIKDAMVNNESWKTIHSGVLEYFRQHKDRELHLRDLGNELRQQQPNLRAFPDEDIRSVVQPMIASGKLRFTPGLKIALRETA